MFFQRMAALLIAGWISSGVCAQTTQALVGNATTFVEKKPTRQRLVGMAEIQRASGLGHLSLESLTKAIQLRDSEEITDVEIQLLRCWRMLPVAPAQRESFRAQLGHLRSLDSRNSWLPTWELYLLTGDGDRSKLLSAIRNLPTDVPTSFPSTPAEKSHFELQQELGRSREQSAMEVISSRDYSPLHALRDLDRALTREADFLKSASRPVEAKLVIDVRNRYRQAYLKMSRHLVEKLFALNLANQTKERDALLAKAKTLPYLHDRQQLTALLKRLDDDQAWKLVIEPMFTSELTLIDHPPDLAGVQSRTLAELRIQARKKTVQSDTTHYEGNIRVALHAMTITCEKLTVLHAADPSAVILTGNDRVRVQGIADIQADRFTYHAETGNVSLSANIVVKEKDKDVKLRSCALTPQGELRDQRSFLDDFKNCFTIQAKLDLLPKITQVYDDDELPDEVRYLLALSLVRPHLIWQAPFLPPQPTDRFRERRDEEARAANDRDDDSPWREALGGEKWMLTDIPAELDQAYRESLKAWYKKYSDDSRRREFDSRPPPPDLPIPEKNLYFWRLREPNHVDVVRAVRLLAGVSAKEHSAKARRWQTELRRNNTVLTFDIAGAAPAHKVHSVLMDVRNAERVSFKLYRVQKPEELVYSANTIGRDFLYRDHGLDLDRGDKQIEDLKAKVLEKTSRGERRKLETEPAIAWKKDQLIHQWEVRVADLKHHSRGLHERHSWRHYRHRDWHDDFDADYFDDECSEHRERIEKDYRPRREASISSWQCDRVVSIPAKALGEAGAYVLVAEANGRLAHVPIVVEPLSLTLRRCRDGIFALTSDAEGTTPLENAKVIVRGQHRSQSQAMEGITDKEGVTFVRAVGYGDQPIVVHHQGRFAVGGFGDLFSGIYEAGPDDELRFLDRLKRAHGKRGEPKVTGFVYRDQHVVVAYSDRPTYRPGQDVQFKLIVRKLESQKLENTGAFRAQDFDAKTKLALPDVHDSAHYDVLDPKGRVITSGTLKLNDFGTAAGHIKLNAETPIGDYAFRIRLAGEPRIVPEVFSVLHYRRSNFEVKLVGVPESLSKPEALHLRVTGQYYFGPPVTKGIAQIRVLRPNHGKPVLETEQPLKDGGYADFSLQLPKTLEPGKYFVVSSITDDSGRGVTKTATLRLQSPDGPKRATGLDKLPRFIGVGQELRFPTTAKMIHAEQDWITVKAKPQDGIASLRFTHPGWYQLKAGDEESTIFAYGGEKHPREFTTPPPHADDDDSPRKNPPKWVNLSDFGMEEDHQHSRWEKPWQHLYALFDRQALKVGDSLRLLVYVPSKPAKLLFTIEGRTILDYHVRWTDEAKSPTLGNMKGHYRVVEIPIKERYFPNVYVQGRILAQDRPLRLLEKRAEDLKLAETREEDDGRDPRWCRVDVSKGVSMRAPQILSPLNVLFETDRGDYRPGDTVRAKVKVTDHLGNPRSAEVSLAAVDESVFAFGEDRLDGIASFFAMPHHDRRFLPKVWRVSMGSRWSAKPSQSAKHLEAMSKQLADLAKMQSAAKAAMEATREISPHMDEQVAARPIPLPRLGGELPMGQLPPGRLREHFHETATWLPQLRTDEAGVAQASFTLPDSLTRYRLTSLALTKETEVGVGRAFITAGLPLAVQVFLPRFGVEKDRLLAVALIHNHGKAEREVDFAWQIDGAKVDAAANQSLTGRVKVAAAGSVKVGLWITLDRIGNVRVAFRGVDGKDSDTEVRVMPVEPIGRPAEFAVNEVFAPVEKVITGKLDKQSVIQLPAGFVPRELNITIAASDLAQALSGLDYLVDYPYGCIEQTMSRFLPAVMVKHGTLHSPVTLQPEIARKLPDVLKKGLTRIYGYQHADGSWGWFEKDSRNFDMSVYVVYGLARCQATGTPVDADVLRRGCTYLREELRNKHDDELVARAWHALALAGFADVTELEKVANHWITVKAYYPPEIWCNLALACRASGLQESAERLWGNRALGTWSGRDTPGIAVLLQTQLAFGAPYADCRTTASRLLERRSGTCWAHTRDTSWAIEALSGMLGYVQAKNSVQRIDVSIAGKTVFEIADSDELKKQIWRFRMGPGDSVTSAMANAKNPIEIRFRSVCDEPLHISVRAVGVQRMDEITTTGDRIKIQRRFESLDGEPVQGPFKVGQIVRVRLRLEIERPETFLLLEERRPSLCEFADDRIAPLAVHRSSPSPHQEFRDDRLCVFFPSLPPGAHEFVYYLRAETPGTCTMLPGCAFPMYDAKNRGETPAHKVEVRGP